MSSLYKKKFKTRKYKDYTEDDLSKYLKVVKSKKLTQEQAAVKYVPSRRTLCYKLVGKHDLKPGKMCFFLQIRGGCLC